MYRDACIHKNIYVYTYVYGTTIWHNKNQDHERLNLRRLSLGGINLRTSTLDQYIKPELKKKRMEET